MKEKDISPSDIEMMVKGGVPADEKLATLTIATKYAMAHKGIILPREKQHLESLGVGKDKLLEIIFCVGQVSEDEHSQSTMHI